MKAPYPRVRNRETKGRAGLSILTTFKTGSPPPSTNVIGEDTLGMTEMISDMVTPGYTTIVNNGGIVNNMMRKTKTSVNYATCVLKTTITHPMPQPNAQSIESTGTVGYYRNDPTGAVKGSFANHDPLEFRVDHNDLMALAAIKARNRVSPAEFQALVSVAEFPKTIDLIAKTVRSLRQIRKSVVTGNPSYAIKAIGGKPPKGITVRSYANQTAQNRWLEFRYGWTPLLMEVQGAIKALSAQPALPLRATARGFEQDQKSWTTITTRDDASVGLFTYSTVRRETVSARAFVLYTADLTHQRARDFGLLDVPLALWEVVPYSFVVDWFIPIGNWLEALTPKIGVKVLAEGVVFDRNFTKERTVKSWTKQTVGGFSYDVSGTFVGSTDVYNYHERVRFPNLNSLYSFPPFNVKLNVKRAVDAIALLKLGR